MPVLGSLSVADIDVQDVQRALLPIWGDKTETASRLRGRIEAVLAWATVNGYRSGNNPARWRGNLDATLPKPGKIAKVTHLAALDLKDAAKWYGDLRSRNGTATRALEFLALTAARSGEVRSARVDEFDTEAGVWIIPASRMKAGKEHRVPLGNQAKEIVSAAIEATHSDFLFPAARGGMLSDMALSACMRRIHDATNQGYVDRRSNRPAVPHGLRSTFRDWAAEKTDYPRDMAEIALAHSVGSEVERAYRRGDMLEKRRLMMAEWESFLTFGCPKEK